MPVVHSLFPAGALITNGLGTDCDTGTLITSNKWHLLGCDITIIPVVPHTSGGSKPLAAGEIQNFYQPLDQRKNTSFDDLYKPVELEARPKNTIIVKFKFNDIENEKEFILNKKPYKIMIKVLNIINITNNVAKVTINNIISRLHDISVKLKNINLRKD